MRARSFRTRGKPGKGARPAERRPGPKMPRGTARQRYESMLSCRFSKNDFEGGQATASAVTGGGDERLSHDYTARLRGRDGSRLTVRRASVPAVTFFAGAVGYDAIVRTHRRGGPAAVACPFRFHDAISTSPGNADAMPAR